MGDDDQNQFMGNHAHCSACSVESFLKSLALAASERILFLQ